MVQEGVFFENYPFMVCYRLDSSLYVAGSVLLRAECFLATSLALNPPARKSIRPCPSCAVLHLISAQTMNNVTILYNIRNLVYILVYILVYNLL